MTFSTYIKQHRQAAKDAAHEGRLGEAKKYRDLATRISIESAIFTHLCETAIAWGWSVSLCDGEEWTVKKSRKLRELRDAAFSTDADTLLFRDEKNRVRGRVWLIYGNDGWDVVSDNTVNYEDAEWTELMASALRYADQQEKRIAA